MLNGKTEKRKKVRDDEVKDFGENDHIEWPIVNADLDYWKGTIQFNCPNKQKYLNLNVWKNLKWLAPKAWGTIKVRELLHTPLYMGIHPYTSI